MPMCKMENKLSWYKVQQRKDNNGTKTELMCSCSYQA